MSPGWRQTRIGLSAPAVEQCVWSGPAGCHSSMRFVDLNIAPPASGQAFRAGTGTRFASGRSLDMGRMDISLSREADDIESLPDRFTVAVRVGAAEGANETAEPPTVRHGADNSSFAYRASGSTMRSPASPASSAGRASSMIDLYSHNQLV